MTCKSKTKPQTPNLIQKKRDDTERERGWTWKRDRWEMGRMKRKKKAERGKEYRERAKMEREKTH